MSTPLDLFEDSQSIYAAAAERAANSPDAKTPCSGYDVRALISHHILTLNSFAAPIDGGPSASFPEIIAGDDATEGDPKGATDRALDRARAAYSSVTDFGAERTYNLGPIPIGQAMAVLTMQNLVHAWDLAQVSGTTIHPSDALLDLVEAVAQQMVPNVPPGLFEQSVLTSTPGRVEKLVAYCGREV